jgi:adenosylcobinamide-GDP ribazoletransferase
MVEYQSRQSRAKTMTPPAWLCRLAADLAISVAFCTRLPLAQSAPTEGRDVARASWAIPVVGALVGGMAALVYWAGYRMGLPPWPAAALALAAAVAVTGALHEDGLADTADGFGGGKDRAHKLAIMRDSRLGTYGACALAASFMLRWSALASLADPLPVAIALVTSHASARGALPAFMRFVSPARSDGLSAHAGRPPAAGAATAALLGAVVLLLGFGASGAIICLLLLTLAGVGTAWLSMRQIGGQTGDVAGALEQAGEILVLLAAAVLLKT